MTVVVDASVLVALTSDNGPTGDWAAGMLLSEEMLAPELALVEATNILRRLERTDRLSQLEAGSAAVDLVELGIQLFPFAPQAARVWALRANLTSYDALYVAIAEHVDAPLATLDRKLARAPGTRCAFLLPP